MTPELGTIEGYYGGPWTWAERADWVSFLRPHGYRFHLYAPKTDPYLRRRWKEPHPQALAADLSAFAAHCRAADVRFGVGLSPLELYRQFDAEAKAALADKLAHLDSLGVTDLGVFFDDMRGDLPDLARSQLDIVGFIAERSKAARFIVCPTYYTDDRVLDRIFGDRPAGYLEELGAGLDPAIGVFWTGEEVCSREYGVAHLERVAKALRRAPTIWDNYPVNDGPRMSPYLHIRSFTGRPAAIGDHIAAHAINPALQPTLSRIPALTLAESYARGAAYNYGEAFYRAAETVLGPALGDAVTRRIGLFQDSGLNNQDDEVRGRLRDIFAAFDHPAAREIVRWANGEYIFSKEQLDAEAFG